MITHTKYEEVKKDTFDFLIGIGVFLFYYFSQYFPDLPLKILGINIMNLSYTFKTIYLIVYELIILLIIALIYKDTLIKSFKAFQKNKNKYFKKYFKYWFVIMIGMMISNFIIMCLNGGGIANNEQGIRNIFDKNPLYVYISGVMIAPILEELVFRFNLRKIFKTDTLFIIMSGVIFGCAHVVGQAETIIDYLYIIPYSIPGFVFGYLFVKTNNIFTSMSMHIFHNGILIALQFFTLFFGSIQ